MAHVHYKGTGKVHSFRGLLADSKQEKIRIEGATGEIAWRITKFQIMPEAPITSDIEAVVKVYRESQTALANTVNFTDDELLAAAVFWGTSAGATNPVDMEVIFDNALFSRNIHVSGVFSGGTFEVNYYIELEEVKISAAGMAQLAVAAARRNRFTSE